MQVYFDSPDSLLAGFSTPGGSGRLVIVAGVKGVGKTRWCRDLAYAATRMGIRVSGLLSPAVFEAGFKVGIDLLALHENICRRLAVRKYQETGIQTTENWILDEATLEWGNSILAGSYDASLLILDELGLLELERGIGLTQGIELISSRRYELAVLTMRPTLLEASLGLWPWAEVFALEPDYMPETSA